MNAKPSLHSILFIVLLGIGLFLRTYTLTENPPGFFADEASIGYNAYTISTTGIDEFHTPFPLFFRAFGEYKSPIQIYSTVPFIRILGLNEFATRLPSALYGTLSIIALYLLTRMLFHNKTIALFAALFLAISPWHIHFSRIAFELMPFIFFTTLGTFFFLRSLQKIQYLYFAIICFGLALYSYFPARLFIPLFTVSLMILYAKNFLRYKKHIFFGALLSFCVILPLLLFTFSENGFARWKQVNIFTNPPLQESVISHISRNYVSHFSLDFLFLKGDIHMPGQFIMRHSVAGIGELYLFQLPLLMVGFFFLVKRKHYKELSLLFLSIILYPIGSMFTVDTSVQATRSIIGVIPFQILSAYGLYYFLLFLKQNYRVFYYPSILLTSTIILFSLTVFVSLYFMQYPLYAANYMGWQHGYRHTIHYFYQQESRFDQLLITHRYNAGEALLQFYLITMPCKKCVVMANPIIVTIQKKQLFALREEDIIEAKKLYPHLTFHTDKIIFLPNGKKEIFIGKFTP